MLVLGKHGRHRVVVEDDHDITNIITQSAVLRQLAAKAADLTEVTKLNIQELGLARPRTIYTVRLDDEAKRAFIIISENVRRRTHPAATNRHVQYLTPPPHTHPCPAPCPSDST